MISPFEWTDGRRVLWARVEAALDQGQSPLLDPVLRQELDADPALLEATSRLMRSLELVQSSPAPPVELTGTTRSSPGRVPKPGLTSVVGVAAALLLIFALRASMTSHTAPPDDSHAIQHPERAPTAARPAVTLVVERVRPKAPLGRTVTLTEVSVQNWTLAPHPE